MHHAQAREELVPLFLHAGSAGESFLHRHIHRGTEPASTRDRQVYQRDPPAAYTSRPRTAGQPGTMQVPPRVRRRDDAPICASTKNVAWKSSFLQDSHTCYTYSNS